MSGKGKRAAIAHWRIPRRGSDTSAAGNLLGVAEHLMRRCLRQTWSKLPLNQRRALTEAIRHFDPADPRIALAPEHADAAAWILAAMHWCGCRHPAALRCKPLHPPTGLVRWLSGFDGWHQTERPTDIACRLLVQMRRTLRRSRCLVAVMFERAGRVVLLPELLR
jgi:hypothetical protein